MATHLSITSPHNDRVREAMALRDRRGRQRRGLILIDGARELERAIHAGVVVVEAFVSEAPGGVDEPDRRALAALERTDADVVHVPAEVFGRIAYGERAAGVVGVAEPPRTTLADLRPSPPPLVAVLEGVEKPGNLGAVLRSADGAGVGAVIVAGGRTDVFNPNTIRASLGTVFSMPVATATVAETLAWLRAAGLHIVAARVDGAIAYTEADLTDGVAIVLGSEAGGLSAAWSGGDVTAVRIPMRGAADSLNVAASAAVLFYEALRQRTSSG